MPCGYKFLVLNRFSTIILDHSDKSTLGCANYNVTQSDIVRSTWCPPPILTISPIQIPSNVCSILIAAIVAGTSPYWPLGNYDNNIMVTDAAEFVRVAVILKFGRQTIMLPIQHLPGRRIFYLYCVDPGHCVVLVGLVHF